MDTKNALIILSQSENNTDKLERVLQDIEIIHPLTEPSRRELIKIIKMIKNIQQAELLMRQRLSVTVSNRHPQAAI